MSETPTVRDHLEAIRDRHRCVIAYDAECDDHVEVCASCGGEGGQCPDYADAVAALDLLDAALELRIIPQDMFHPREEYTTHPPHTHRLVPDPTSESNETGAP